jgi:cysteine-S-conjugate beta-lyase
MTKTTTETRRNRRSRTQFVSAGREPEEQFGFVNTPIYRGSTVLFPDVATFETLGQPYTYATKGTPTVRALESAWTEIAGADDAVAVPSGLAACNLALMTALKAGDHALIVDSAYQPTRHFCDSVLSRFGVAVDYYDPRIGAGVADLFRDNTRAVLTESPGSLTMEIQDVPAIAHIAHERGACVILDNSWATPIYFPAHEKGVDICAEAGTKYLSGHSDILLGLVSATGVWAKRLRATYNAFAMCPGPEDAFLALRGMRTMELRLREQSKAALDIAQWLATRPEVARVLHPALAGHHPDHDLWARDFSGASGLFTVIFKPRPKAAIDAFVDALELFGLGYSWGGYESLIVPFHGARFRTAAPFAAEGPGARLSIGLEDVEDLKEDLARGLAAMNAAATG